MTEREVKQLLKLLDKFRHIKDGEGRDYFDVMHGGVLSAIRQWVVWYGRDDLNMDL